jgi:transcriptional regulator with PAS, ATPase and Fis domain
MANIAPDDHIVKINSEAQRAIAIRYIRDKVNQLLTIMGTLPLNPDELDDETLIALDPIGIIAESFSQILAHLQETNDELTINKGEVQSILDTVGTSIVVVDNKLQLLSYNKKCNETIFRNFDAPLGTPMCDLFEVKTGLFSSMFKRLITAQSQIENADYVIEGRHFQVVATPILDEQKRVARVIFSFSDISGLKEIEEKLRDRKSVV